MYKRSRDQQHQMAQVKLLLTVDEAAKALSIGRSLAYELVARNELVSIKVGRTRRIPLSTLQDYVTRCLVETQKAC